MIADLVWMITILSWWKRLEWCHLCTGSFSPCSGLHWCSPLTVSSLPSSAHGALYLPPRSPMITSDMAATSPFCIKGSMRMLTAEGWVWKERASGNTVPWEFLLGQSYRYQNVPQDSFIFWWKWEYSIIPAADFPWEVKLALSFAHLVTLHHTLLFIPNSSPWCGIDSCAVVLQSGTFFTFFFFFCCGSVFLFANCLFSRIFPCPPCLLSFIFLPRKTWLRYQKKMKLQKLKFKKKKT